MSVLFADLVGFTPFAEDRDPEEVRDTLSRYFELTGEIVARYGGTVEKFIGDAVMAVWGAPVRREADAERAVRAALEIVDAVRSLGPTMEARAAVDTGEAAVTIGAVNQAMVAGDLVNTASRLQSAALPGCVLVGETTHRAAGAAIAFEEAGTHILKGKASPVPAWRAVRITAQLGGLPRRDTLEPPFVGRTEELRLLKDLLHATSRERRACLVSVMGPAGIGKSRLAWELRKYADGQVDDVWWHEGRSPAHTDGATFWALGEMVRQRCGLLATDDEATTREKVRETVGSLVEGDPDRRWVESALLALLAVEVPGVRSEHLFGAWRAFFERLAAHGTVVLVFEDLHHADPGLLDFIDHLLAWSRGSPIYVLALSRPELLERRSDFGARLRSFTSIHLDPLPDSAIRDFLVGIAPGLPSDAIDVIARRSDGIPLYAVETVRMLISDGRLAADGAGYAPAGDLAQFAVPETLTELVAARLDDLPPTDRRVLLDAAVLGQSFTTAALASVSGVDELELEGHLRFLVSREVLALQVDPMSVERGQYAFIQSLVREVAYNTLARPDRKSRHLAAARYYEASGTGEMAGALAAHYLAAWRNAREGAEADALAAQTRIALTAAARRAALLGSHVQALSFLEQALAATTNPADEADILELAGESASLAGRHGQAEATLRRAVELRRGLPDRAATARAVVLLGRALIDPFELAAAIAVLEPAADEFRDLLPDPAAVALLGQHARARFLAGENRVAVALSDEVLEAAETGDLAEILADTLVTKGSALYAVGRPYEGMTLIEAGGRLAEARGHASTALRASLNRCSMLGDDDPRSACALAHENIAAARRIGDRGAVTLALDHLSWVGLGAGAWDDVIAELDGALAEDLSPYDRADTLGNRIPFKALRGEDRGAAMEEFGALLPAMHGEVGEITSAMCEALVAFAELRFDDARAEARRCVIGSGTFQPVDCWGLILATRLDLWQADLVAARRELAGAETYATRGRAVMAELAVLRAGIAALDGRLDDALAGYRSVLPVLRDLGIAWNVALTGIDMVTLLDVELPDVRAAADDARRILRDLRATPIIDHLEAVIGARLQVAPR